MGRTKYISAAVFLSLAAILFFSAGAAEKKETPTPPGSEDCLSCHEIGEPSPKREPGSAPNISAGALLASPHARLKCVDCHSDITDFPHNDKLAPVDCGSCHVDQDRQYVESLHGKAAKKKDPLAPTCKTCHGTHNVRRNSELTSPTNTVNVPALCGQCHHEGSPVQKTHKIHADKILENYSESIHGEGLFTRGLSVTAVCTSCHTAHFILPHTDPRSSINAKQIAKTCTKCHVQIERVHRKVIRGVLWEKQPHLIPACVDCHSPHKIRKVFYAQGMADKDCLTCHARKDLKSETGILSQRLHTDQEELSLSRHAKVACVQCHTGGSPSLIRSCATMTSKVDCSICHNEVVEEYSKSIHGTLVKQGSPDAPYCSDCHGTHGILGKKELKSSTYPRNIPALCARCHRKGEKAANRYKGAQVDIVEHYTESIHGKGLLESGLTVTATCANCHTAHGERPAKDPLSSVNPANLAKTCAQCHRGIYELFEQSIHSPAVSKTDKKLPECADCHSAHAIGRTDVSDFRLHIMDQCGNCHGEITRSYFDTYHGKISKLGYLKTAKCYDCHGAHDILPTWNPASHLSRGNIVKTCGQCHPGSNRRFAGYLTHATHHDPGKYPFLFYTFWGMTLLLIGTLVGAGLHTALWIPRSIQFRRELKKGHAGTSTRYIRRVKPLYSKLHLLVIVSFLALALTGMTLKFSYTGWARFLARLFGGFETAGIIHRIGALITFFYFGAHLWDLMKRVRKEEGGLKNLLFGPNTMLLTKTDFKEFVGSMKWFVGLGPRPEYGRWTYWEKFDYFAVFWGVAIIGSTGLLLWFPEFFTNFLPGWFINVATIIHSDEALLAVGFIFTIHFFNTHFRPEKFPIDTVIFTGTTSLEEFKADRPREYEELVASGMLESRLEAPPTPAQQRFWRIFGFSALGIGLAVIGLIVYAMIFAYR
jgi:predicted CXXCH cytochrome family protein